MLPTLPPLLAATPAEAADSAAVAAPDPRYIAKATQAALQFEGFFIAQMLHQMRSSTRTLAGEEGAAKDVNNDMLDMVDTMVADKLAGQRAFGVADAILRQLLPQAPAAAPAGAPVQENLLPPLNAGA